YTQLVPSASYPLSLHDALPIFPEAQVDRFMMKVVVGYPTEMDEFVIVERMTGHLSPVVPVMTTDRLIALQREVDEVFVDPTLMEDRKSTRLNSSHEWISYAVFC